MVAPAYATFAARLLDIAADPQDPVAAAHALGKLCRLVRFGLLPLSHLPRLVAITGQYLPGAAAPDVWLAAVEVAVATGDDQLRATVGALASGEVRPAFTENTDLASWVRNAAQSALLRADDPPRAAGFA